MTVSKASDLDEFTTAYLECALWSSSSYDENGENGIPLDEDYDIEDISEESLAAAVKDCEQFRELCIEQLGEDAFADWSDEQAGHDFWLTRNGHGAGFWDRGLENGDELSKWARSFGSVHADAWDGKVHFS